MDNDVLLGPPRVGNSGLLKTGAGMFDFAAGVIGVRIGAKADEPFVIKARRCKKRDLLQFMVR
jgi:hypothetical protein